MESTQQKQIMPGFWSRCGLRNTRIQGVKTICFRLNWLTHIGSDLRRYILLKVGLKPYFTLTSWKIVSAAAKSMDCGVVWCFQCFCFFPWAADSRCTRTCSVWHWGSHPVWFYSHSTCYLIKVLYKNQQQSDCQALETSSIHSHILPLM